MEDLEQPAKGRKEGEDHGEVAGGSQPEKATNVLVHRTDLKTLQQTTDYVSLDIKRWQDQSVARVHEQHLTKSLNVGPKSPIMSMQESDTNSDAVSQASIVALEAKFDALCAAISNRGPPRPVLRSHPGRAPSGSRLRLQLPNARRLIQLPCLSGTCCILTQIPV